MITNNSTTLSSSHVEESNIISDYIRYLKNSGITSARAQEIGDCLKNLTDEDLAKIQNSILSSYNVTNIRQFVEATDNINIEKKEKRRINKFCKTLTGN